MVTPNLEQEFSRDDSIRHPVELSDGELLNACEVQRTRRSGPGGQHRNKVETAIVLTHRESGMQVEASECRSQGENLAVALERMRVRLAVKVRTPVGSVANASELWRQRCRGGKIVCNPSHVDFPRLLAEALNEVAAAGWEMKPAAERLGCSSSQLLKLIKDEPAAWTALQEERRRLGLKDLH